MAALDVRVASVFPDTDPIQTLPDHALQTVGAE
jgi:hypothetical protein